MTTSAMIRSLLSLLALLVASTANAADLKLLFLGDNGHHQPAAL